MLDEKALSLGGPARSQYPWGCRGVFPRGDHSLVHARQLACSSAPHLGYSSRTEFTGAPINDVRVASARRCAGWEPRSERLPGNVGGAGSVSYRTLAEHPAERSGSRRRVHEEWPSGGAHPETVNAVSARPRGQESRWIGIPGGIPRRRNLEYKTGRPCGRPVFLMIST